jgi:cyclophilin family peptidyl-prolyl cis-trans isomerase
MLNKKSNQNKRAAKQDNTLKIAAGVVLLAVVAILGWIIYQNQAPDGADQGSPSAQSGAKQWSEAPEMAIDPAKQYFANVKMENGGEFTIQLYPDKAPLTVNSFVFLARQGFFDGVTFHRVLEGFMAQGGDPTGTGTGGPGYKFANEDSDLTFDKPGVVAMANAGRDTNGSQFFITFVPTPQLNGGYTIFGQVIEGMEVVNAITRRDPTKNPSFPGDRIESITITEQ